MVALAENLVRDGRFANLFVGAPTGPTAAFPPDGALGRDRAAVPLGSGTGRGDGWRSRKSLTGGGSDSNFTAALGAPTLDGLGGAGERAHAGNESILVDRMADRTALIGKLLASL